MDSDSVLHNPLKADQIISSENVFSILAAVAYLKPQLKVVSKYALAELTPPKLSDIPAIRAGKPNCRAKNRSN